MKPIHSSLMRTLFALALLASPAIGAQAPAPAVPVPHTLEQAAAQRARASQMVDEADKRYADEEAACYKKFLVNDCLVDARKRHTDTVIESRNLDAPAREFERAAKRAEVEAKEAKRAAERPLRDADQSEQAETFRADEAAKAAERQKKIEAKAVKAAEGRKKTEEEQAERLAKQQKRANKDAERAAKKAEEAAKAAAKTSAPEK